MFVASQLERLCLTISGGAHIRGVSSKNPLIGAQFYHTLSVLVRVSVWEVVEVTPQRQEYLRQDTSCDACGGHPKCFSVMSGTPMTCAGGRYLQVLVLAVTLWIAWWSQQSDEDQRHPYYVGVLGVLTAAALVVSIFRSLLTFYCLLTVRRINCVL